MITTNERILNYILNLKTQSEDSIVNKAFKLLKELHSKGRNSFLKNVTSVRNHNLMVESGHYGHTIPRKIDDV